MEYTKTTLGLQLPTDPRWVDMAAISLEEILTDHAYCELKAATSCITLITRFPDKFEMVEALSPVVTEEWGHFRMVLRELKKRNLKLGHQRKDEYVGGLMKFQQKGGGKDHSFLEQLLIFALIEARSCERFRLLSLNIADEELKSFYHDLMVAEAGHYRLFLDLAKHYFDHDRVMKRWNEYLKYEAELIQNLEVRGDRMH